MKKHIIWLIIGLILLALCVCGLRACGDNGKADSDAAASVDELIEKINDPVTLEDKTAIEAARAAYNALNDKAKAKVTKLDILENAEAALATLETDSLSQAAGIDELIGKISSPVTLEGEDTINAARAAFNALSDEAKTKVTKLSVLEAAEAALAELKANTEGKTEDTQTSGTYSVGDKVTFTGGNVYVSPTATEAARVIENETTCDVTITVEEGAHRYHLISNDGGGAYGWCDGENIKVSK